MIDLSQLFDGVRGLPTATDSDKGFKGLMIGVIYSLQKARDSDFRSRSSPAVGHDYSEELDEASRALENYEATPADWLGGFYFNSALVRIAAGSHRALRRLLKTDKGSFKTLAEQAISEGTVNGQEIDWLGKVYNDVNCF